jgi:hypothetical protein
MIAGNDSDHWKSGDTSASSMRALIPLLVLGASLLPVQLLGAPVPEVFPIVERDLLDRCRAQIATQCLADISWALSREEKRRFNLGQLAPIFAELRQWDRAEVLLARRPADDTRPKVAQDLQVKYVEAERLAAALAANKLDSLSAIQDPLILSRTASRLLGYPPREGIVASDRIGRRLSEGLWERTLTASRSTKLALLKHWERLGDQNPNYLKVALANKYLLLEESARARDVASRIQPKPKDLRRDLVELWLRLGEPKRALDAIGGSEPRYRGLYKTLVTKSLAAQSQFEEVEKIAWEAASDSFAVNEFGQVLTLVELLAETGRIDLAKQITVKAEQLSEAKGPFRPFDVSAVGEMYGLIQDRQTCLKLQAKALGLQPERGKPVAWGLISGPIGYGGGGMFDLGPELRQNVAARSIRCGDKGALTAIDNRWLATNYCDYYRRGLIGPKEILQRPQKRTDDDAPRSVLLELAAECHFERKENEVAISLLHRAIEETTLFADFHGTRAAAELACVFASPKLCRETLERTADVLIKNVAARRLSPQHVVEFAAIWQDRAMVQ